MYIDQIEKNIKKLVKKIDKKTFIYDLLLSYGLPKASISRLKSGNLNLSKNHGEIRWKKKLFYKEIDNKELHLAIDQIINDKKLLSHSPRFIIVTNFNKLLAFDTKTKDPLETDIKNLPKYFDFFLPWISIEKTQYQNENPADVKAAEKMAKLFDEIKKNNHSKSKEFLHNLNAFLIRLLFCLFAEDTKIFQKGQFINVLSSHTKADGSDLKNFFQKLFSILNKPEKQRNNVPNYLIKFPYVNGGLFKDNLEIPTFSYKSKQAIIEASKLDWSEINPDIFGSMMQAVVRTDIDDDNTKHYTSVPNIMKVIEPLFLNQLYEEFENSKANNKKLNKLLIRISKIKIFDPACGSGNFLIIAYKELRRLEIKIIKEIGRFAWSEISLNNFYGIELDDFACEVAKLSLWLTEHQMNIEFKNKIGESKPALPLKNAGKITHGNACLLDWMKICPHDGNYVYILGNPPYLGGKLQNKLQKNDMKIVFSNYKKFKNLDYIACWFFKASEYLSNDSKVAFVSTNSICQGTQVSDLWPNILNNNIEIYFAVKDFEWSNNAKYNAGVICSIIGLRTTNNESKYIYHNNTKTKVKNISAYLISSKNIFIKKRVSPISDLPKMRQGNIPLESGHLRLSSVEKNSIIKKYPQSKNLFKKILGSSELINSKEVWCLWINNNQLKLALKIPPIKERIDQVYNFRKNGAQNAKACANRSHQFCMTNLAKSSQLILPIVSSIRRSYIPSLLTNPDIISINSALVIDDPELYIFGIINSKIHLSWVKIFAGKLKSDFRYSMGLCWYSFPFPNITQSKKDKISRSVLGIIEEREKYSEKTLAELYDPDKMPKSLKEAHHQNDITIEQCYRSKPFKNDDERLKYLFNLYEKMIEKES